MITLIKLLLFAPTWAGVNLLTGAFQYTDLAQLENNEMMVRYSSRSLYTGHFGFGWCSDWDWKLTAQNIKLCDQIAINLKDIQITKSKEYFEIRFQNKKRLVFDSQFRLTKVASQYQEETLFFYDQENLPLQVKVGKQIYKLTWHRKLLVKISNSTTMLNYQYNGRDLIRSPLATFKYRDHNLVLVQGPKENLRIDYDEDLDIVKEYANLKSDCFYRFRYPDITKSPKSLGGLPSAHCKSPKRNIAGEISN